MVVPFTLKPAGRSEFPQFFRQHLQRFQIRFAQAIQTVGFRHFPVKRGFVHLLGFFGFQPGFIVQGISIAPFFRVIFIFIDLGRQIGFRFGITPRQTQSHHQQAR